MMSRQPPQMAALLAGFPVGTPYPQSSSLNQSSLEQTLFGRSMFLLFPLWNPSRLSRHPVAGIQCALGLQEPDGHHRLRALLLQFVSRKIQVL